jgi:hypothetical protein
MKTLSHKYPIYILTVVVMILESIFLLKCVDRFKSSLGPGSFTLPAWCVVVLDVTQYTIFMDVFGAILLGCLGIRRKEQTYVIVCLAYLILWSCFILSCLWCLRSS